MAKSEKIIKYTIIPKNDNDDYDKNFKLSLKEFAKALESKSLIAPLILYNSDLDVPMDMEEELEEYCIYTNQDNLIPLIKNQENTDIFRCLILHGFDISLDDIRDVFCPISRRNEADVCINVIKTVEVEGLNFKENLTFYLRNDLDQCTEEEWAKDKKEIEEDMEEYINEWLTYDDLSEEEMMELLPYLLSGDMDEFDNRMADIKKKKVKEDNKEELNNKIIHIPLPEGNMQTNEQPEEEEFDKTITCSYECDGLIALSKIEDDFYVIEDDDYEMTLNLDQMLFLIESFNRIKDKPVK